MTSSPCHRRSICISIYVVHVSFEKFRSLHPSFLEEDKEDEEDSSEESSEEASLHLRGFRGHRRSKGVPSGNVTKHDPVLCGRKNVKNMEKFPPDFPAGDLNEKGQDYRLSNSVFNTLKIHSRKEERYVRGFDYCLYQHNFNNLFFMYI